MDATLHPSSKYTLKDKINEIFRSGIDPLSHLKQLDFPRRAGTLGDKNAAKYIASTLSTLGYKPIIQEFHHKKSSLVSSFRIPLVIALWAIITLLNLTFLDNNKLISLITFILPLIILFVIFRFESVMKFFFKRKRKELEKLEQNIKDKDLSEKDKETIIPSQNVITEIGQEDASHQILFTAHFDSISSKLPMRYSKIIGIIGFISFLLFTLIYTTEYLGNFFFEWEIFDLLFPFYVILLFTLAIPLEFLMISRIFRGNNSHGIIDDGTGVAILLELARYLKTQNIDNFRFTFGFFGAEEAGLIGSSFFHRNSSIDKNTHVISVDMIGEKPPIAYVKGINPILRTKLDTQFNDQLIELAEQLDIDLKGSNFMYPGSDFAHWLYDGHRTNWLINGSKMIHSKNDNMTNVNKTLVLDAMKLLVAYLSVLIEETSNSSR